MKRIFSVLFAVLLLASTALADGIDLSGMSLAELSALQSQITLAMWATDEWQEVKVPAGVYEIGVDIPAGMWTITMAPDGGSAISIASALNDSRTDAKDYTARIWSVYMRGTQRSNFREGDDVSECSPNLEAGTYLIIDSGYVIFTPYVSKPLGFK